MDINVKRLFQDIRLNPWKERDALLIESELRALEVFQPDEAKYLRTKYEEKHAQWKKKSEPVTIEVTEEPSVEPVLEAAPEVPVKRKRRSKKSSPTI